MNKSIHYSERICNSLKKNKLYEILSGKALRYIVAILISMFSIGYKGKTVNIEKHSNRHRTSISRFLNSDGWGAGMLEAKIKQTVIETIYQESRRTGKPILCIVDDTIASKTIPSTKAKSPIESASFHYSHLKGKQDYGHQAVGVMLSCNGITLNYSIIMYDKSIPKTDIVKEIANELPEAPNKSYLLCDSWYVCGKIMDAFIVKGFYTVGALKTNRIIYPYSVKMSVSEFAQKLTEAECKELFHIVTVRKQKYYVYRYEGKLNDIENAVVLLTYPMEAFGNSKALRAFISTDISLDNNEIFALYVNRWNIEVFFRDVKNKLALDKYQIRSASGIRHLWLIASVAYMIACFVSDEFDFCEGYRILSRDIFIEQVEFIFDFAVSGGDKSAILEMVA